MSQPARAERRSIAPELVLDTALRLFSRRGYFNTSVHDIASEAGVSIGSIYHHFGDKEGIARAMFRAVVERLESAVAAIEARHATAHDRCRAVIQLLFRLAETEPELVEFMLHAKHREFMPDEKPMCSSRPFAQMRAMVADGMAAGEIRQMDPLVAAAAVFGGALRLIHLRLDGILERPLDGSLDEIWAAAWASVAARPA